jgi:hypothetical protein
MESQVVLVLTSDVERFMVMSASISGCCLIEATALEEEVGREWESGCAPACGGGVED